MTCARCGAERCRANLTEVEDGSLACPECLGKTAEAAQKERSMQVSDDEGAG